MESLLPITVPGEQKVVPFSKRLTPSARTTLQLRETRDQNGGRVSTKTLKMGGRMEKKRTAPSLTQRSSPPLSREAGSSGSLQKLSGRSVLLFNKPGPQPLKHFVSSLHLIALG